MRRQGPCYRDRWVTAVIKTPTLPASTRLFLTSVLARHMKADGWVSVPRTKLADEIGETERAVSRHIQRAKDAGWVVVLKCGYRGQQAEYGARIPDAKRVTVVVTLLNEPKGDRNWYPFRVTDRSPITPEQTARKGDRCGHPIGSYVVTPAEFVIYPASYSGADPFGLKIDQSKKNATPHLLAVV